MKRRRPTARAGFGLIEILVVLILILLLSVWLLPRLVGGGKDAETGRRVAAPKQRAEQTVGASNTHQLDLALQMYRDANEGRNPATLGELKRYGATDEMLLDPVTRQPLAYDPQTGRIGSGAPAQGGPALPRTPGF